MITALMLHTAVHLSHLWHIGYGPRGWWAWSQSAREAVGYGFARGHYIYSWEVRP